MLQYLLAKCSIRECVSACGNIGDEAGLQEMHRDQQGLGEPDLTWTGWTGRLKSLFLQEQGVISPPEQVLLQPSPRSPVRAEVPLPSTEPRSHSGSEDITQGPGNSRLREVSLEHGLHGQVTSLWVLAEILLGAKLVLQCRGKVPHVLTGCGLQTHRYDKGAVK